MCMIDNTVCGKKNAMCAGDTLIFLLEGKLCAGWITLRVQ